MKKIFYNTGEEPRIGDLVELDAKALRASPPNGMPPLKKAGTRGTVFMFGRDLNDPMPQFVFVNWEDEVDSEWKTSDTYVRELNLIRRAT